MDRAAAALSPDPQDAQPKAQRTRQKRSPKKAGQSPAALAEKRRQAVHRYLVEQGKPMGFQEIRRSLNISDFSTRSALKRLVADGLVIRTGTGTATRYSAKPHESKASALRPSPKTGDQGTMQGRLLATIQDRGSASVDELAQAVRTPREVVQRECGALIREEEIRMARRDGRAVYVAQQAA
ncbi:MAG: hypothetical protein JJE13_09445 [Thermoleophilia bacterium]|nr:hypothetical protein [Thermoleophilia bacterium]